MGAETSWADGDLCLECYGDKIVDIHNECVDDNKKRKKKVDNKLHNLHSWAYLHIYRCICNFYRRLYN